MKKVPLLLMVNAALVGIEIEMIRELLQKRASGDRIEYVAQYVYVPHVVEPEKGSTEHVSTDEIDQRMIDIITEAEGFYPRPYRCPRGVLTIGYGFTERKYLQRGYISQKDALNILKTEVIPRFRKIVQDYVKVPLTRAQENALVSFTYNLGEGNLAMLVDESRGRLNRGNYKTVPDLMKLYNKCEVRGKMIPLSGLTKRREIEGQLFKLGKTI